MNAPTGAAHAPSSLAHARDDKLMKVAILAGGLGTRLGILTRDLPKPMIPVGGRPFLEFVIESFQRRG